MEVSGLKKCIILWILILGAGFPLFAQSSPKAYIFFQPITGAGSTPEDKERISTMLSNEIRARNCALLDSPYGTDFILYGMLGPYYEGYEEWYLKSTSSGTTSYSYNALIKETANQLYVLQLMLRDTKTNDTLVQQILYYASMDEVYNFFPLLIHNLFAHILGTPVYTTAQAAPGTPYDASIDNWRNKWLYLRTSVDFPITFYQLKEDGLIAGIGVYDGENIKSPTRVSPLDNQVVLLPSLTVGLEVQFLNWLSIEPKFQVGLDHMNETDFFYMAAGLEVKVPLKFLRNIMLEPYGTVSIPILTPSDIFVTSALLGPLPWFGFGGGFQISTYGGKAGAILIDVNYMYFGDVGIYNPHGELFPKPKVIHYNRSVIGLGVGYKVGFINRKSKEK